MTIAANLRAENERFRTALEKISGRRETTSADHNAAGRYKPDEGVWDTSEYLADSALDEAQNAEPVRKCQECGQVATPAWMQGASDMDYQNKLLKTVNADHGSNAYGELFSLVVCYFIRSYFRRWYALMEGFAKRRRGGDTHGEGL